jgi:hypothetical protein
MASYKTAADQLRETGAGLHGTEYVNFQDYIVKHVCRYYYELEPVLGDRPNVTPWYTNEDSDEDESKSDKNDNGNNESNFDDEESLISSTEVEIQDEQVMSLINVGNRGTMPTNNNVGIVTQEVLDVTDEDDLVSNTNSSSSKSELSSITINMAVTSVSKSGTESPKKKRKQLILKV